jgi:hypothetical protein
MSENQPNDLEDRAGRAADELSGDHRATAPEAKPIDEKAEAMADDVRAETGEVYDEEDTGDDRPSSS